MLYITWTQNVYGNNAKVKKNLAKGRPGENNCSTTHVLTALIIIMGN
jgi:hypothetical protein